MYFAVLAGASFKYSHYLKFCQDISPYPQNYAHFEILKTVYK